MIVRRSRPQNHPEIFWDLRLAQYKYENKSELFAALIYYTDVLNNFSFDKFLTRLKSIIIFDP